MKTKFLKFQLELVGTSEEGLADGLGKQLEQSYADRTGIYDPKFGDAVQLGKNDANGNLVLCGCIVSIKTRMCRGIYKELKLIAKGTFTSCTEVKDMLTVEG